MSRVPYGVAFTVEASDDLGRRAVLVKDKHGRVAWRKTRELVGDEIVDFVVDAADRVRWTIHKPTRGWYLVLRSPLAPSARSFVALRPSASRSSPERFVFDVKPSLVSQLANAGRASPPLGEGGRNRSETLTTGIEFGGGDAGEPVTAGGVKRRSITALAMGGGGGGSGGTPEDDEAPPSPYPGDPPPRRFVLEPLDPEPGAGGGPASGWSRFKSLFADAPCSFACSAGPSGSAPPAHNPTVGGGVVQAWCDAEHGEVFRFVDSPSLFALAKRGVLELGDEAAVAAAAGPDGGGAGLDASFWVAVALAYLDFRQDKEAYLAAMEDVQY